MREVGNAGRHNNIKFQIYNFKCSSCITYPLKFNYTELKDRDY